MNSKSVKPPLIAIVGPTASGKTALAIRVAKKFNGAIISADSQQLYQHAQIGTNQPLGQWRPVTDKWLKVGSKKRSYFVGKVPYFFIDQLSPNQRYSAVRFQKEVAKLSQRLFSLGYMPIMTGGTGLYVSAVIEGYSFPQGKPNIIIRQTLAKLSTGALEKKLKSLDSATWKVIDRNNRRRLIRALEHIMTTKTSFSQNQLHQPRPNTLIIGLKNNKSKLKKNITTRTQKMFRLGLINETKQLLKKYPHSPLLNSIGYCEVGNFLNGQINRSEAEQQIISHTWQYARRQKSWFKKIPAAHWIQSVSQTKKLITNFLVNH